MVAGIREYFNVMLGTQLLYKFERPQYAEVMSEHQDTPMSQVYGAPHLLRLFGKESRGDASTLPARYPGARPSLSASLPVRIGAMLAYTPLDEKSLALLLNYLQDFLK